MKTPQQIEEMAKKEVGYFQSTHRFSRDQVGKFYAEAYTQAQKDILESASEGFDDCFSKYATESNLHHEFDAHYFWQACSLSKMKELQDKDEEIEKLNQVLAKTSQYNKLAQDEITELKKALEIANKAIGFYADPFNYNTQSNVLGHERPIRDVSFTAWKDEDFLYQGNVGGNRAREAQKQIKEVLEGK